MKRASCSSRVRKAAEILAILERSYPDAHCALNYENPYQLLVATVLSAQCTDVRVNLVTPALFSRYPDPAALSLAALPELEALVRSTGFYHHKARNLIESARRLCGAYRGEIPRELDALVSLPGVGRKTANVVLGNAFGLPSMVVDTHVKRISNRLGWTCQSDPVKIETELSALIPQEKWTQAGHLLIAHGRSLCKAPTPLCSRCPLSPLCPRTGVDRAR